MHRQHRAREFKKFLATIDKTVPAELDVHLICGNYGTHKTPAIKAWLARHPRFHMHHADRLLVDQPGRTLVRLPDRPADPAGRAQERSSPWSRTSETGSIRGRSCGRRPPKRPSNPSPDIADEFQADDTKRSEGGDVVRRFDQRVPTAFS
jgi:hypothetical protein